MGDAVGAATGQVVPEGYYHLDRLLTSALRHGAQVALCGACMNARALDESEIVEGAKRSSLEELSEWTLWADNVVTFSEERGQVRTSRVGRASRDAGLIRLP